MVRKPSIPPEPEARAQPSIERVDPEPLSELLHGPRPPLVLDVRSPEDFLGEFGHIDGASLFPMTRLGDSLEDLRGLERRSFVLVSDDERLALRAAELLLHAGFGALKVLTGGMQAWLEAGLPVRR